LPEITDPDAVMKELGIVPTDWCRYLFVVLFFSYPPLSLSLDVTDIAELVTLATLIEVKNSQEQP